MSNLSVNRDIIDDKKFKSILHYVSTLRNSKQIRMMMMFNFLSGMRCINFCYLQLKDVLDQNGQVRDIISLTPDKNKGNKKCRYFVSNDLKKEIKEYTKDFDLDNPNRYLFVSQKTGKPYNRSYLSQLFSSIYDVFNLHCSTHFGRRMMITNLIHKGIDISTVSSLVSHKNITTTSKYVNEDENVLLSSINQFKLN